MRKPLLMAGIVLLFTSTELTAQVLNWGSSFSPPWANGNTNRTATNVAGTGVDINVASVITGGGSYGLSPSAAQTPTVSGATFTVPGSAERLQLNTDFATNTSAVTITITFSALVRQVSFRLADIDKSNATSTTYFDRATITGYMGSLLNYTPSISKYDATDPAFLQLGSGTAAVNSSSGQAGNTASDLTDQRGTITVDFGGTIINKVVIVYDNAPGADADPAAQDFAIGNVSFQLLTLPVNLVSFSAAQSGNDVQLRWTTAQESNSSYFAIERSNNASDWSVIGTITARGNTTERTDYTYTDINPAKANLFYRLKQVDQDGNFKYSSVARISNKDVIAELVTYPNPFSTQVNISLHSAATQQVTSTITDIAGRTIQADINQLHQGNNNYSMVVSEKLPSGIYWLRITDEQKNVIGQARLFKK
jgi:hypothetical protein